MEEILPRQERLKRREKAKKVRKIIFSVFVSFVGVFVIIWTVGTLERLLNWNSIELVPVKQGVLEDCLKKESVIIRKESVLSVPKTRSIKYLVEEGERVHAGALLLKIQSAEINRTSKNSTYHLYAPSAGTVSKKTDGLENVLTPVSIRSLNLESVYDKVTKGALAGKKGSGEPAIKIVDNLSPAYLCFPAAGLNLKDGGTLLFRISGSQELCAGRVTSADNNMLVAKVVPVPKEMIVDRLCTIEVITKRADGLVVPASSLVKKKNASGLYAVSAGKMRWVEVKVLGIFNGKAVVNGVNPGQEIVANPENI